MAAPLRRFVHASLAVVFIVSSYSSYAHANPEEIEQHQDAENDDDNSISHHTNRGGGQGLSGISWTDDIQWKEGQEKTDGSSTENDEQRRRREERERRKREKEEKKQHEREERERRQRERDERRRQEREDRERREQERRDRNRRGPAPAPAPRPPIRTSSDSDTAMARWLRSMGYGPADWMKLSPALRNELNRMAMQDMMKARSGMPSTLPPSPEMRAALQKLMEGARAGGAAFGNARSWMNSEDMQGGNSIQGLRNLLQGGASGGGGSFVTEDGRTVTPQPPTEFGPWPGETEEEWVERLAQNLWQSTYDKALWDIQQQRIAREAMGYRESSINEYQRRLAAQQSGYDPQVEADKAYAQWLADLAAKNAQDPQYREYLKNASEEDLAKQNLNRDGTMRVHMGVAHRGEGMGPQLDFSKRDAADAAERRAQTASLQRQRAETAAQLARWDAERAQRSEQRAADNEARRQQRIADASAQRAGQPAAAREPATATWVDGQGNTVHWTSNNGRSTVTTIDGQGHAATQTTQRGTGAAQAAWTDAQGNQHQMTYDGQSGRSHTVTDTSGKTQSAPVTTYSSQASASWTDDFGNRHTLTSGGQGVRTQTTTSPSGLTTSTTTVTGTGRGTATWIDAGGNTQTWTTDGRGNRTQTTITPSGQVTRQNLSAPGGNYAVYDDAAGNRVTLTGNADGSRTQTTVKPDGSAEITTLSNRGTFANWTDAEGNRRTLTSNSDGTRTLTTLPADGGKPRTEKLGGEEPGFISSTGADGSTISIRSLGGGRREVVTSDAAGNSTTTIRGGEAASASSKLPDGTVIRVTNAGGGIREIVTQKPGEAPQREYRGAEPASVTLKGADGSQMTVTANPDGTRQITTTAADGKTTTETRGREPASASTRGADGTIVTTVDRGDGTRAVTVTTPDGKTRTQIAGSEPNSVTAVAPNGTMITVTALSGGVRQITTTTADGRTTTETRGKEPVSTAAPADTRAQATVVNVDGTVTSVTEREDGKRDVTTTTPQGQTTVEVRGGAPVNVPPPAAGPAQATVALPDGTQITVTQREDGRRDITTQMPDGKTTTETRGGKEQDTATVRREDGTTVTATRSPDGKIDVTVTSPQGEKIVNPAVETPAASLPAPETPAAPGAAAPKAQPSAVLSFTDEDGRVHTVAVNADGGRVETTTDAAKNTTQTLERAANGSTVETTVAPEGTTRTTTVRDDQGNQIRVTEHPDGSRTTVVTDPATGQRTVIEEKPVLAFDNSPMGKTEGHFETRDAEGKLVAEGQMTAAGHMITTEHREDGSQTRTFTDSRDHSSKTLDYSETGFGTETVRDAEGNVLSQREVFVRETRGQDGSRTVTVTDAGTGEATSETFGADGSPSSFNDHAETSFDPGRAIFERQRADLGLSQKWEDLRRDEREAYAREQKRRDDVAERQQRDSQWREAVQRHQEEAAAAEEAYLARMDELFKQQQAQIEARGQADLAAYDQQLKEEQIQAKRESYQRQLETEARQAQSAYLQRYEEQVPNPGDPSQVRQFQISEVVRNTHEIRDESRQVADTGKIREPDGLGGFVERDATPEEIQNAQIRIGLANNLDRILAVESGNQVAKLEAAQNYNRLLQQTGYDGNARDILLDKPLFQDSLEINDLRHAVRSSGNAAVDAYERAALDTAAGTAHQKIEDGLLRGASFVTFGLNDWFASLNPGNSFLQAAAGVKTSGADIGRDLSRGERFWELGSGLVDLGVDIGSGLLLQEATRMPGSRRVVADGDMQNPHYHYDVDTGLPGTRMARPRGGPEIGSEMPDLDLASGAKPRGAVRMAEEALHDAAPSRGIFDRMPGRREPETEIPRAAGEPEPPAAPHPAQPSNTPPPGLSREQLQDWHDRNGMHDLGEGSDGGDDMLPGTGLTTRPAGAYSNHLTQDEIDNLFQPGRTQFTGEEITQKADLIRTGRAPREQLDPDSSLGLDLGMRKAFPEINLRNPLGSRPPAAPNVNGQTQAFNNVLPTPAAHNFDPHATGEFNGVLPTPHPSDRAFFPNGGGPEVPRSSSFDPNATGQFNATLPVPRPTDKQFFPGRGFDPAATQEFNAAIPTPAQRVSGADTQRFDGVIPARNLDPNATQKFDAAIPPPSERTGAGSTQKLDAVRTGPGSTQEIPRAEIPAVPIPKKPITDEMVYSLNPPRPMDVDLQAQVPDITKNAKLARQRTEHWIDHPEVEAGLDGQVREMLRIGAEAGSVDARRILEHGPAYGYQPDMDAHLGLFNPKDNVARINPYVTRPQTKADNLQTRDPVALAGTIIHETAGHGRGLPDQIPNRGGTYGAPPAAAPGTPKSELPLGQGQGQGYNEFRAFFKEAAYYERMRQVDPALLDGLDPSSRRLADKFHDAVAENNPQALRDAITAEIAQRQYERFYPTPDKYARALTPAAGGSNARARDALNGGAPAQDLMPPNVDLNKIFPAPPRPKPTIVYPPGKGPAPSSEPDSRASAGQSPSSETPLSSKITDAADEARQSVTGLKEDSTFQKP